VPEQERSLAISTRRRPSHAIRRDVVLTKEVWERTQKTRHFKPASNSF